MEFKDNTSLLSQKQEEDRKRKLNQTPFAVKRRRENELRRERDARISRGTARIDTLFAKGTFVDERWSEKPKHPVRVDPQSTRTAFSDLVEAGGSKSTADQPIVVSPQRKLHTIGCCNDLMCGNLSHQHAEDWTFLGTGFVGNRAVKKEVVPDPYAAHSFPHVNSTVSQNPRDDFVLMQSSAKMEIGSLLVQLARMYHTESMNLEITASIEKERVEGIYSPILKQARASGDELRLVEAEAARTRDLFRADQSVPTSARVLDIHMQQEIFKALRVCQAEHTRPAFVVSRLLLDAMGLYAQDCDESALRQVFLCILGGSSNAELEDAKAMVGGLGRPVPPQPAPGPRGICYEFQYEDRLYFPCDDQWTVGGKGSSACTVVALIAAERFLIANQQAARNQTTADNYLIREVDWRGIVDHGIQTYRKWLGQWEKPPNTYMLPKEALEFEEGKHARIKARYETEELFGSLVKPSDCTEDFDLPRSLEELLEVLRKKPAFEEDRSFSGIISARHKTLAFARLRGGDWWLFDSHGLDRAGKCTLGRFYKPAEILVYLNKFFRTKGGKVDLADARRDIDETTLTTLCSFDAFLMYNKN